MTRTSMFTKLPRLGAVACVAIALLAGCADAGDGAASTAQALAQPQASSDLRAAMGRRDDLDAALARQMGQVGAALTSDQQRTYAQAFARLPEVDAATTAYENAAKALDGALSGIVSDPSTLASVMNAGPGYHGYHGYDGGSLYADFQLLAQTRYAGSSLKFAMRLLANDAALANLRVSHAQVVRDLVVPSLPPAVAEMLFETGSSDAAYAELRATLETSVGACNTAIDFLDSLRKLGSKSQTNPDSVDIASTSVGKTLRSVSALLAMWDAADAARRGDASEVIRHLLEGGPDAVAAVADATSAFRRIVLGIEKTELAEKVADIAERISGAAAIVLGVLDAIGDLQSWNASDEAKVRLVGDLVGIGAGLLTVLGLSTPAGILGVVALGISIFADILHDRAIAQEDHDQKYACLPMVFQNDPRLVAALADANPGVLDSLSHDLWMTPDAIQKTARLDPDAIAMPSWQAVPTPFTGLIVLHDVYTLSGAECETLLERVAGSETNADRRAMKVDRFLRYTGFGGGFSSDMTIAQADAWLDTASGDTEIVDEDIDAATWKQMVLSAKTYADSCVYEGPH